LQRHLSELNTTTLGENHCFSLGKSQESVNNRDPIVVEVPEVKALPLQIKKDLSMEPRHTCISQHNVTLQGILPQPNPSRDLT
jgi:hypothetical protein